MFLASATGKAPGIHSGSVSGLSTKMGRGTIVDRLITAFGKGVPSRAGWRHTPITSSSCPPARHVVLTSVTRAGGLLPPDSLLPCGGQQGSEGSAP